MFYMFFAEGFEEVEAIATLDVIRRAGIDIKTVSIADKTVTGSHGIPVICDITVSEAEMSDELQGVILPGGMPGTNNLLDNKAVHDYIEYCAANNKFLCAICAAPMILGKMGLLAGREAICFPGYEEDLEGAVISRECVCRDKNIITAKGMGSAVNFGIAIVAAVKGKEFSTLLKATLQCS